MSRTFWRKTGSFLAWIVLGVGCVTAKIDWNSRVGVATYDQTVLEMGPPDRMAQLTDGTTVAEWRTQRGRPGYYPDGGIVCGVLFRPLRASFRRRNPHLRSFSALDVCPGWEAAGMEKSGPLILSTGQRNLSASTDYSPEAISKLAAKERRVRQEAHACLSSTRFTRLHSKTGSATFRALKRDAYF